MTNRKVTKQPLGEQDVLWGTGTEEQQRGAGMYPMKRVTRVRAIPTWADFADAEPEYPGQQYSYKGAIFQHAPDSTATVEVVGSLAITTEGAVLVNISTPSGVTVLADIPAPYEGQVSIVTTTNKAGVFVWTLGDFTTEIAADILGTNYVESSAIPGSEGVWKRLVLGQRLSAVPTSGSYSQGDYVWNITPSVLGSSGTQYVIKGWIRLTTGSGNTLNVDWVEDRSLTGT